MFTVTIGMKDVETQPSLQEAFKSFHNRITSIAKTEGTTLQFIESTCWIQEEGKAPIFFDQLCERALVNGWLKDGKLAI